MLRGAPECSMSSARKFALVKMAREAQKPLAKMEFFTSLWLVGYRLSRALPCSYYFSDSFRVTTQTSETCLRRQFHGHTCMWSPNLLAQAVYFLP